VCKCRCSLVHCMFTGWGDWSPSVTWAINLWLVTLVWASITYVGLSACRQHDTNICHVTSQVSIYSYTHKALVVVYKAYTPPAQVVHIHLPGNRYKVYVIVIPQAWVLCLNYMHKCKGRRLKGMCIYSGKSKVPVVKVICTTMSVQADSLPWVTNHPSQHVGK